MSERITRTHATLPEQMAMKNLLESNSTEINGELGNRRFNAGWSHGRVATSAGKHLNSGHSISVAKAFGWSFEPALENGHGGVMAMRQRITALETIVAELRTRIEVLESER